MKNNKILLILLGIITILAQTILLRELLVEINGNEIVFSIYLSLWLCFVASGSWLARFFKTTFFLVISIYSMLLIILPVQFWFIRTLADAFTLVSGQVLDLTEVFLLGFILLLPGCLLLGFLFPHLIKLLPNNIKAVHKGYLLECLGIILGSAVFAVSILLLSHFTIICLLSSTGFLILYLVFKKKYLIIFTFMILLFLPFAGRLQNWNYSRRYENQNLIYSKDSIHGRLDVTNTMAQKNYYWNGDLFATTDNSIYSQQTANFSLLQHPKPKNVLLVGGLLNGLVQEILTCVSLEQVDYLEMDKNILAQAKELSRVNFISKDPVRFIQTTPKKYDLILLDLPDPSSLFLNRFYTKDFFQSMPIVMRDSISAAVITLSSGTNFMTSELIELNSSVYNTLRSVFDNVILIPAEKNIYIASRGNFISNDVTKLQARNRLNKTWFNDNVIDEKCNELRVDNIMKTIRNRDVLINTIADPVAYLSTIQLHLHISDLKLQTVIKFLHQKKLLTFSLGFIIILLLGSLAARLSGSGESQLDLNIFSISLINFVMQLILLNIFQIQFGYLFFVIFLFTASFMLGLITGFQLSDHIKVPSKFLWLMNLFLIILVYFSFEFKFAATLIFILNVLFAFMEGVLLSRFLAAKRASDSTGSSFYFLDSLGAMSGGLVLSVFLIPLLGFQFSILILILLIVLILLTSIRKFKTF